MESNELLRRYVREGSEDAFHELVRREVGFVYAAALRQVGRNPHLAQEVVQAVFTALAHKATRLAGHPSLSGWLHTSTRYAATKIVRDEQRRHRRMNLVPGGDFVAAQADAGEAVEWSRIEAFVDDALHGLREIDRRALLLRYFEGRSLRAVGVHLGLSEEAARKRIDRALESLRSELLRRGLTGSAAALGASLAHGASVAAPAGMAAAVSGAALASVAAGTSVVGSGAAIFVMSKSMVGVVVVLAVAAVGTVIVGPLLRTGPGEAPGSTAVGGRDESRVPAGSQVAAAEAPPESGAARAEATDPEAAARIATVAGALQQKLDAVEREKAMAREREAVQGSASSVGLDPTAPVPASVDTATIGALRQSGEAVAHFRTLPNENLFPHLQYLYTLPRSDSTRWLMAALFQVWTERDPTGAMAAAKLGGSALESRALEGWAATDLNAGWTSPLATIGGSRIANRSAIVGVAVDAGRAAEVAEMLLALPPFDGEAPGGVSESFTLAERWSARDPLAVAAWLKRMEGVNPEGAAMAAQSLGRIAMNMPMEAFAEMVDGQSERIGNLVLAGAVRQWVGAGQLERMSQFEAASPGMSDSRRDMMLGNVGGSLVATDPDLALRTILRMKDPVERDRYLGSSVSGAGTGPAGSPEKSMAFAMAIGDATLRAQRIAQAFQRWRQVDPGAAQAYISRPGFPVDVRRELNAIAER